MTNILRLLVVDDEPGMRTGVERALRHHAIDFADLQTTVGFAVDQAASGEEALEAISRSVPDVLLLDYKLPDISGLEVQERLGELNTQILTVMVSAYSSLQTVIAATKRGAFDFLVKPFTPDELRVALQKSAYHLLVHRQALKLAEERRQIRFEFIRVLGHELKAPLAAVEGYLRLLRKRVLGTELDKYDEVVDRSVVRLDGMTKLISDLLDLTRIESGNKQRDLSEVDLCRILDTAAETAQADAERRQIAIRLNMPATLAMTADRGELEIILNNLISNAVKYNRHCGSVTATLRDLGERVEISVADTGIGMSEAEKQMLFGEFSRIRNCKTAGIPGSGLGLSIVRRLTDLYAGSISVQSDPDGGSTFTVSLDKSTPAPAARSGSTPGPA